MKRIIFAVLALLLNLAAVTLQAQNPGARPAVGQAPAAGPGEVRGAIVAADSSAAAVPRPAVGVRNKADGKLVTGAYGAEDGTFRVQGLRPGTYYLRVGGIGFTPMNTPEFTIDSGNPVANVGTIKLSRVSVTLQSVQITGEKPTVVIEPDRNTYRAKDVAPAAANASDVLQATPSVEVDQDGKVSLRGNENVVIQINGRPTPIKGTQLAAYLKQIPANIVERVEVVPNPSAKYDPDGMAGIINIVLKTNADLGLSAGLNTGFATPSRFNTGGNVGYQSGPVTLFGTYGFNADDRAITGLNDRSRFTPTGAPQDYQNQDIDGATRNGGHNFTGNIDYKLTDKDVVSNSLTANRRHNNDAALAGYEDLDASQAFLDRYVMDRNTKARGLTWDNSLSWKHTITPRTHELSSEVRFNRSRDEDNTLLWREPQNADGSSAGSPIQGEVDSNSALTRQLTAQTDYTRPLWAKFKASYSRRIRRPGTQELNPFPVFFDQQNVFIGNPRLNPEYTDAIELGASKTGQLGSIQLSPFYRHTKDVIRVDINTADTVDNREVTSVSFQNLAKSDSWGTDLNGNLRLGPKLNALGGLNVFKMVTDGGSQSALGSNAIAWSARLNATTQLNPTVILQANYFYRGPMKIEKGKFSSFQMTNITVRKKLDGDNMSVAVRFADPFNQMKFKIKAGDDYLEQVTQRQFGVRATYFTFQWNYGKPPRVRLPQQDQPAPAPVFP